MCYIYDLLTMKTKQTQCNTEHTFCEGGKSDVTSKMVDSDLEISEF